MARYFPDFLDCQTELGTPDKIGGTPPKRPTHGFRKALAQIGLTDGQIAALSKKFPSHQLKPA